MCQRLVALLLLFVSISCSAIETGSRDAPLVGVETVKYRDVRGTVPMATEVEDMLGQGNSPGKKETPKKISKNSSGKSNEGGYYKTYGSDAEGEKGYMKATYSKGNHGYKTLDTFHKQDGDKYAFEKHVAFGKGRDGKKSSHHGESASHSSGTGDHEAAGTMVDTHYATHEDDQDDSNEQAEASDHGSYTEGQDGHYTDHGPESSSYGQSKSYSNADGEHGSYESRSSYSKSSDSGHEGDGDHYY